MPENIEQLQQKLVTEAFEILQVASKHLLEEPHPEPEEITTSIAILTAYGILHGFNAKKEYEKKEKGN